MARRQLLTEEERRVVFGVPMDRDALARHYTLTRTDLDLVATRRGDPNRLGFAVQLMLLRHTLACRWRKSENRSTRLPTGWRCRSMSRRPRSPSTHTGHRP
jgi:Domain of unknown function (DUF4158)